MIHIEFNPAARQLKVFGTLWFVIFGILGGVAGGKGSWQTACVFWTVGTVVPAAGLIWPRVLRFVYVAASILTYPIGIIASQIILLLIYYLVLTPIGLVLRFIGKDSLHLRFDRTAKTYWTPREQVESNERYFRQF